VTGECWRAEEEEEEEEEWILYPRESRYDVSWRMISFVGPLNYAHTISDLYSAVISV